MLANPVRELTGRGVLALLIAFFGTVFAVNGYFLASAITTYTGVVAQEPYRKGLAYNRRIDADERQASLGWTANLTAQRAGLARLDLATKDGRPVVDLVVTATLGRPSTALFDRTLTFIEIAPGQYESTLTAFDEGTWVMMLTARENGASEPVFQLRRRLWLKP